MIDDSKLESLGVDPDQRHIELSLLEQPTADCPRVLLSVQRAAVEVGPAADGLLCLDL